MLPALLLSFVGALAAATASVPLAGALHTIAHATFPAGLVLDPGRDATLTIGPNVTASSLEVKAGVNVTVTLTGVVVSGEAVLGAFRGGAGVTVTHSTFRRGLRFAGNISAPSLVVAANRIGCGRSGTALAMAPQGVADAATVVIHRNTITCLSSDAGEEATGMALPRLVRVAKATVNDNTVAVRNRAGDATACATAAVDRSALALRGNRCLAVGSGAAVALWLAPASHSAITVTGGQLSAEGTQGHALDVWAAFNSSLALRRVTVRAVGLSAMTLAALTDASLVIEDSHFVCDSRGTQPTCLAVRGSLVRSSLRMAGGAVQVAGPRVVAGTSSAVAFSGDAVNSTVAFVAAAVVNRRAGAHGVRFGPGEPSLDATTVTVDRCPLQVGGRGVLVDPGVVMANGASVSIDGHAAAPAVPPALWGAAAHASSVGVVAGAAAALALFA